MSARPAAAHAAAHDAWDALIEAELLLGISGDADPTDEDFERAELLLTRSETEMRRALACGMEASW